MTETICRTELLEIAYLQGGPADGIPAILLHGWPDDATTFRHIAPALQQAGFRTIAPWLRGFGNTRFRSDDTPRSGEIAAMAQDVLDLADALGLGRFAVVGHDWGARIAYLLASVFPERVSCCAALSLAWEPGRLATPALAQAQAFWYQWFLATERGAEAFRAAPKAFARFQWESWSPAGWFDDALFDGVAASFDNPDWVSVTLHAYRVRWEAAGPDPRYTALVQRQMAASHIAVPTLLIHGEADRCTLPASASGKESHFTGPYAVQRLPGIGHFPTREAPEALNACLLPFLQQTL